MELLYTAGCPADLSKPLSLMSILNGSCENQAACFLIGDFSFMAVPLQSSLWRLDFDVRLAGLSSGTEGHQSFTGVVPPFLPLPAQTDPVHLSDKSPVKEVPPGCQQGGGPPAYIEASTSKSCYSEFRERRKHKPQLKED